MEIGDRAVKPLLWALESADEQGRGEAARALGRIGDPRAVQPLRAALADPDALVRNSAAEALKKIGEPAVQP